MSRIEQVSVTKLFGTVDHEVNFRQNEPTILLAPNGAGKTHVLKLTAAALSLDARTLLMTIYESLTIRFVDGRELCVARTVLESGRAQVSIVAKPVGAQNDPLVLSEEDLDSLGQIAPEIRQVGPNRWTDERTGRSFTRSEVERRFRVSTRPVADKLEGFGEIAALCGPPSPVFIDTWRLDSRAEDSAMLGGWGRATPRSDSSAASRIRNYAENLREEIAEARRSSIRVTQSADLSFAARALEAANLRVNEASLQKRYSETVERYAALARNGLAVGDAPIAFPPKTTPTVRRILSVFLDDWDQRLVPLLPVNEKLQTLRDILDSKLAPSGKTTAFSARGGLEFYSASGRRLPLSRLSSGEQHLVALFTLLLFAAKKGSLVLIDEPEISLHAAWKHSFLQDISRVAGVNGLQIVLATHSAGIVNGRWDLTEELALRVDLGETASLDTNLDDEDDLDA